MKLTLFFSLLLAQGMSPAPPPSLLAALRSHETARADLAEARLALVAAEARYQQAQTQLHKVVQQMPGYRPGCNVRLDTQLLDCPKEDTK